MISDRIEVTDRAGGKDRGWVGAFLGETTMRVREPVFFTPHASMARNRSPGTLIIGSPGGGKSFTAFTLTCQMVIQGVWTIYIDPKADAIPMGNLKGLGPINVLDLKHGNDGILNPFALSPDLGTQVLDALETIRYLVGSIPNIVMGILEPILNRVALGENPSLTKVYEALINHAAPEAQSIGSQMKLMSQLPFARLCFASSSGSVSIRPEDGLTIVTLLGIDLPVSADVRKEDYSISNNLAVTVMYLLTAFTSRLLHGDGSDEYKEYPKAIVIDEAWAVMVTNSGRKVITETARLGRSLNTALILISQNADDFAEESVLNSMPIRMSFRMNTLDEARSVLRLMTLEESEVNIETVMDLKNGECLMYDLDRRVSRVQISSWNTKWREAFDTNPVKEKNKVDA